jgi:hypothetical protein
MASPLTRRQLLASSAAGGAALSVGPCGLAFAQGAKRIEQFAPELDGIISVTESINQLADGVGGDGGPAEGPVWWKEGGYLLFSDINGNRRMKYTPGQGTVEFKKPTNGANGLTRDLQGRLVACEGAGRRVVREEHDGSTTVIASSFQGRRLNRPNDVVVKSDGAIYFSDPNTNMVPDQTDLTYAGVYRVSPRLLLQSPPRPWSPPAKSAARRRQPCHAGADNARAKALPIRELRPQQGLQKLTERLSSSRISSPACRNRRFRQSIAAAEF